MITVGKIAIFGGTFNPPHMGHKVMLEGISALPEIEKILIMPSKTPPHKSGDILPVEHRVNMCRLAFGNINKAEISLEELSIRGKSYSVKTLNHLKSKGIEFPVFVIGGDSLIDFHKWYRYEEILLLAELYVYKRKGEDTEVLLKAKENLEKKGGKITILSIIPPEISSTEIREKLKLKEEVSHMLEPSVLRYIKEHSLYKDE
ncbi:MAG: nicotinate (nicotinamide) nucleotide adenylyltransferase [Acutalibacteraceae bacterium]|nr:nicotinate (nicotinamide) nucleotide adenylyltransferase [Acutalibacteraceae bacterium]